MIAPEDHADTFAAHPATAGEAGRACAICQTLTAEGEAVGPCPACGAVYHEECWTENGGCAAYGCEWMPETAAGDEAAGAPRAFWGQDEKDCPHCGQKIRVAALRCRHCGQTFESSAPMTRREMVEKKRSKPRIESMKKTALTLFVCGIIPCLSPLVLVLGGIWFLSNRKEIAKLPSASRVYCAVGLIASLVSAVLFTLVLVLI